jgi:hypothetical protein
MDMLHDLLRFAQDWVGFMSKRKRWWLAPLLLLFLLLALLVGVAEGTALAPFIYALF